jgi:hypothetical protein
VAAYYPTPVRETLFMELELSGFAGGSAARRERHF